MRLGIEDARRRILRKLHIRWWHAGAQAMQRILDRAGVPKQVIDIMPSLVDACKACRTWTRPLPASVASVDIPEGFNLQVEADLLFYGKFIVFRLLDRCTRWHAACEVQDKATETLVSAFMRIGLRSMA